MECVLLVQIEGRLWSLQPQAVRPGRCPVMTYSPICHRPLAHTEDIGECDAKGDPVYKIISEKGLAVSLCICRC